MLDDKEETPLKEQAAVACPSAASLSVERVAVAILPTEWGDFQIAGYRSLVSDEEFVAIYKGELDRDTPIVFQCHHGIRSQAAADYFAGLGFERLFNLSGGIDAWSQLVDPLVPRY